MESRADFTLTVLNLLDFIGGNFGVTHGKLLASSIPGSDLGPRMMIGKLIAWRTEVTVTPTLIGQMVIDFGKIGVAVEILDIQVLAYFAVAIFIYLAFIIKSDKC